jgi:hypothetical protein
LTATRAERELAVRLNLGVVYVADGNFGIFVIYTGIAVKICLLADTVTQAEETVDVLFR